MEANYLVLVNIHCITLSFDCTTQRCEKILSQRPSQRGGMRGRGGVRGRGGGLGVSSFERKKYLDLLILIILCYSIKVEGRGDPWSP